MQSLDTFRCSDDKHTLDIFSAMLFDIIYCCNSGSTGCKHRIYDNDKTLIDMCVKLPATEEEFLEVSGVGENKRKKYGRQFLDAIAEFQQEKEEKAEA